MPEIKSSTQEVTLSNPSPHPTLILNAMLSAGAALSCFLLVQHCHAFSTHAGKP